MTLLHLFQAVSDGTITPQDAERCIAPALKASDAWTIWGLSEGYANKPPFVIVDSATADMDVGYPGDLVDHLEHDDLATAQAHLLHLRALYIISAITLAPKEDAR